VEAKNDSRVLRIDKESFSELLKNSPKLSLHLSRFLGHRLRDESKGPLGETKIVSIYNLRPHSGQTTFTVNLAASLFRETKKQVLYLGVVRPGETGGAPLQAVGSIKPVSLASLNVEIDSEVQQHVEEHPSGFKIIQILNEAGKEEISERRIAQLLSLLVSQFHFVLMDLPREMTELLFKLLTQSDVIYILTEGDKGDLEKARALIDEMKKSFNFTDNEIKLLLLEAGERNLDSIKACEQIAAHRIFAAIPYYQTPNEESDSGGAPYVLVDPQAPYSLALRYLARELSGNLVGLALGSGAAHGLAHIGVLKVLEEEGIHIDIVAGSSIGAVVGTFWAAGYKGTELEKIAFSLDRKNSFFKILGFSDLSIAHLGFFKGRTVTKFLRTFLGEKTFRDLRIPMRIVATNLFTSEEVVFQEGDLVEALRASISIPGIFRPLGLNGRYLIDGGVIDPLPVSVLAQIGVKKIIAVNVLSESLDILERKEIYRRRLEMMERKVLSAPTWLRWFYALRVHLKKRYETNIFNVLMNTIQFMEQNIASAASAQADVIIHPVIPEAHWSEFYAAKKFIRIGAEKTREQMPEIRRLIEE
jgi:NTE family protein